MFYLFCTDVSKRELAEIVAHFPTANQSELEPLIKSILQMQYNPSGKHSVWSTRRTRRLHFYMFLHNMGVDMNDDPFMERWEQKRRIWTMALYASHLCTGNTIQGKAIRTDTVKDYLRDVATFIYCQIDVDPRYEAGKNHLAPPIQKVISEYQRFEKIPNRREPWTVEMQLFLDEMVSALTYDGAEDSMDAAVADFTAFGLSAGIRRSEWVQPTKKHSGLDQAEVKDKTNIIGAFLPCDWQFFDVRGRKISHDGALLGGLAHIGKLQVTWRTQKNGQNGETKTYLCNLKNPLLCPVARGWNIMARYQRIMGTTESDTVPLAVYRDGPLDSDRHLLYSDQVTQLVRDVVCDVLNLDPVKDKEEVSRYSTHSLRVGACQILYANGFQAHEIKMLLRWQSDAFMTYLRDIAWVARKQVDAVNEMADMAKGIIHPIL